MCNCVLYMYRPLTKSMNNEMACGYRKHRGLVSPGQFYAISVTNFGYRLQVCALCDAVLQSCFAYCVCMCVSDCVGLSVNFNCVSLCTGFQ